MKAEHGIVTVAIRHTGFLQRAAAKTGSAGVGVLNVLYDYANCRTRHAWPSVDTICLQSGLSKNTVLRGLRDLVSGGFISINARFDPKSGRQTTNHYTILDGESVTKRGLKLMVTILNATGTVAPASPSVGEGATAEPLEHRVLESKAKGVKATALDLSSGLRPSDKSRHEPAAGAGGYVRPEAGSPNDYGQDEPKPRPQSAFRRTARGWWIPVEPVFCQKRRNTNGVQAKATATSKAKATSRATSTDEPPPPRVAGSAPAAGAVPRSLADHTRDTPVAPSASHRPRQRAPRPTDPFFNLFGELVLGGSPTTRTRGLAGEWATRCVENGIPERAIRDWRAELDVSRDVRFLREHNAWQMLLAWWSLRSGKYTQANNGRGALERFGSAGSGEQWAHIRYGIPADK